MDSAAALFQNQAAAQFLTSPVISAPSKQQALENLLPSVPADIKRFFGLLARRERLELVPEIASVFHRLVSEHRGLGVARVTTATPLDQQQQATIAARLSARTGKQISLETHVDPSIIGGVVAQIGDDVIDASVRGRLERLRRALLA